MKEIEKSTNNAINIIQNDWNVETITEQIFRDLNGAFTRSTIQEVLEEVIPNYESARIQTYVPIFIHRDAVNQLKSIGAPFASPGMSINLADARNESQVDSDPSPPAIERDELEKITSTGLMPLKPAV